MTDVFDDVAFPTIVGVEGDYGCDPADPGNWTGGACGVGELRGTKFGVSAAAYPTLDIRNLTLDAARAIYRASYWNAIHAYALPQPAAILAFDCAVNQGTDAAIRLLQRCVGAEEDGMLGPLTMRALSHVQPRVLFCELQAQRIMRYVASSGWRRFGLGWMRRVAAVSYAALVPA